MTSTPSSPVPVDGARALMRTLADSDIDTLFTNPGTSELHLVEAAEATPGLRSVLALFEGTVTGAADGFGRIAGRPAATLLHLGPGQANGWANLHNARRAGTPIVSVVGDQATFHQRNDPPLMSDIAAVAKAVHSRVASPLAAGEVSAAARAAVADACSTPGRISTVVMPADVSWSPTDVMAPALPARPPTTVADQRIREIAERVRTGGNRVAMLLGGQACHAAGLLATSRIAAAAGIRVFLDVYTPRLEHGAGLPEFPRLGFYPVQAMRQLEGVTDLITVGTRAPVAFFAYLNQPALTTPDGAANLTLADVHEDAITALEDLADLLAATVKPRVNVPLAPELPAGPLSLDTWPQVVGALLPDNAIVCDESVSSGAGLLAATAGAPRHDVLSQMGGAMGAGLPMAVGAAIAAPDRPVIALVGDGCAMYTISALWSYARENLDITTIILKNSSYGILREEWALLKEPGQGDLHDSPLINLTGAPIDFVGLAQSMGVPGSHAETAEEFATHLRRAVTEPGPHLIEIVVPAIA